MFAFVVVVALLLNSLCLNVNGGYTLDAFSNLHYRRLTIPQQHITLQNACAVYKEYAPDVMIVECADEQLFGTNTLVTVGLLLANSTDPVKKQEGLALLDQVRSFVYGTNEPMLPLNDVWGYDDKTTGRSYALVGASNGVHIVDVSVPLSPTPVLFVNGSFSIWRDIKIYNRTMYAVNDNNWGRLLSRFPEVDEAYINPWKQEDGLVIIDLSYALQPHYVAKTNTYFNFAHNIQTEHDFSSNNTNEICSWCRPYLYAVGGDVTSKGGFIIMDVSDPVNPIKKGSWDEAYVHDIVIHPRDGKYIAYAAAIYAQTGLHPGLYIIDVTDPSNPVTLHSYFAHYNMTHNCWPTDDGQYLYVTHEEIGTPITIWSISNLSDVHQVGELFIAPDNHNIVAHNVHVRGNFLWVSYYSQGSVVYDITDRVKPVLVGHYDTSPDIPFGMDGTWGIYPYANSHNAYATDMSNGLFVLKLKQESTGAEGPKGDKGDKGSAGSTIHENLTAFAVVFAIVQVLVIGAIVVLFLKLRGRPSYQAV